MLSVQSDMRDDNTAMGSEPRETWLDHVHTSGQIFLLIAACFLVLLSILIAGIESGILVGTLIAMAWFFVAIGWWIVYRVLCYIVFGRNESRAP